MTEEEYVENRIITDEAKLIFKDLDTNQDETLIEVEFEPSDQDNLSFRSES